jgi:hypothetical protein
VPTLLRRDPALVNDDVADGIISLNCARYGVAFTAAGDIDTSATARLRADWQLLAGPQGFEGTVTRASAVGEATRDRLAHGVARDLAD